MSQACRKKIFVLWEGKEGEKILPGGANPALIRDRYLEVDVKDKHFPDVKKNLHKAMQQALYLSKNVYKEAFDRQKKSIPEPKTEGEFRTVGRMVIGLGSENVLETGLTLHHTYGTPVIPGTALKGLTSHYCDQIWGAKDHRYQRGKQYHTAIFGTSDDSGHIIFHDAWITPGTMKDAFRQDIITPHHGDYYSGKKDLSDKPLAPTDFDDPIPVAFLSINGTFHIAVSCDVPKPKGEDLAKLVLGMLEEALKKWGIGGKTSSGYGRLEPVALQNGGNTVVSHILAREPRHQIREVVTVTRAEDVTNPRGIAHQYFVADDGFGGYVERNPPELCKKGERITLVVSGFVQEGPRRYTFAVPGTQTHGHDQRTGGKNR
jgi:CRISPR type III-B/RAMP module RAMP protein Cmr6